MPQPISNFLNKIICGDALAVLKRIPADSIDCVVTSPPYWSKRDYGVKGQLGLERSFEQYLERLLAVFTEIKRVLKPEGTCFVNLGDTYGGSGTAVRYAKRSRGKNSLLPAKLDYLLLAGHTRGPFQKCLLQIPARFALGMIKQGWILRNEIIWHKPNVLPESVKDRFTVDYEKVFFFVKRPRYFFAQQFEPLASSSKERLKHRAINPDTLRKYDHVDKYVSAMNHKGLEESRKQTLELGRNKRSVWSIPNRPFRGPHFATFPSTLVEIPIKAGCPEGGIVLDPFVGSGTTAVVARQLSRNYIGIEISRAYCQLAQRRIEGQIEKIGDTAP